MQVTLYADLARQLLSETLGGGQFAFPTFPEGDEIRVTLLPTERIDGNAVAVDRDVRALRAGIGLVDQQPTGGAFRLRVYDETGLTENAAETGPISATDAAATVEATLTAAGLVADVVEDSGSWLIDFLTENAPAGAMDVFANTLAPASFVRITSRQTGTGVRYEVRPVQAPVAFTDEFERVLPPAPTIHVVEEGRMVDTVAVNEVQALYMPPQFKGVMRLRRGDRLSASISREDDEVSLETACISLLSDTELADNNAILVELVADNLFHLTFQGDTLSGTDEPELVVEIIDAPAGDVTFSLSLDTAEVADALRGAGGEPVEFTLEIEAEIADATAADDEEEPVRVVTLYRDTVRIVRDVVREVGVVARPVDWQKPRTPETYRAFSRDQLFYGARHYVAANLEQGSTEVEHGLDSEQILHTVLDTATGQYLGIGADYSLHLDSADAVTIEIDGGVGPYILILSTAGAEDHFLDHNHEMDQVNGLPGALLALGQRITALEELIPATVTTRAAADTASLLWPLPDLFAVLPVRRLRRGLSLPEVSDLAQAEAELAEVLLRGGLLPALHDAAAEALPADALPNDPNLLGKVFTNNLTTSLAGAKPGEHVATDGLRWYQVRELGTGSWYPADLDKTLWQVAVNERQLPLGKTLTATFAIQALVLKTTFAAQWVVRIEYGTLDADAVFNGAPNLEKVTWDTENPILEQQIAVTNIAQRHEFGLTLKRQMVEGNDSFVGEAIYYGHAATAPKVPTAPKFALRARLCRWDTEDAQPHEGYVLVKGLSSVAADGTTAVAASIAIS